MTSLFVATVSGCNGKKLIFSVEEENQQGFSTSYRLTFSVSLICLFHHFSVPK